MPTKGEPGSHDIQSDVFKIIDQVLNNGDSLKPEERDRLLLAGMGSLDRKLTRLEKLKDRIENLERVSIGVWIREHPKFFLSLVVAFFVVLNLWFVSDFRKALLPLLGFSPDILP